LQGNLVKKVSKDLNINQKELADMLDIPQSTVNRWLLLGIFQKQLNWL